MSKVCDICGKEPRFGKSISHSHRRTPRRWTPNIQKKRIVINGKLKRVNICTRCLRKQVALS